MSLGSGYDLRGVGKEETIIRIYCMKKKLFSMKDKRGGYT